MRILLVIVQYPPDVNSTGLLMERLCRRFRKAGHRVSVLTSFPHYDGFRVREDYRGRLWEREERDGIEVLRFNVWTAGRKEVPLHRLLSYLSFNAAATVGGLLSRKGADVVLCTNGSFFSGLTGALLGRAEGAAVIYNVQDLYPEVAVEAGVVRSRLAVGALRRVESLMYRAADHVSVITPSFRRSLRRKGVPGKKISVIPNFADTSFIRPLPKDNAFARRHGLEDRFVISHAGNLGHAYDLESLVEAARLLRHRSDLLFLIVGEGVARAGLEDRVRELKLSNVRFLPFQPTSALPRLRAASDVQVALYREGAGHNSMPSKVYEIMASGRPVLAGADPDTDLRHLVEETGCGLCVEPGDAAAVADAVLELRNDDEKRRTMAQAGRRAAVERYSEEAVAERYLELFERLAGETGAAGRRE